MKPTKQLIALAGKRLLPVFLGLSFASVQAQDLTTDLAHIRDLLKDPQSLWVEIDARIEYTAEMDKDRNLPRNIHTVVKMGNGCYLYENEMVSMVINRQWMVGVMHAQKQIVYARNNAKGLDKARKEAWSKDIPSDPGMARNARFEGEENGIKKYRIDDPGKGLRYIDLQISTDTHFFTRFTNEYADPSQMGVLRTVTEFKRFDDKASFRPDEFSEKRFLRFLSDKTVKPAEKYRDYQLIYTDPELLKNF